MDELKPKVFRKIFFWKLQHSAYQFAKFLATFEIYLSLLFIGYWKMDDVSEYLGNFLLVISLDKHR